MKTEGTCGGGRSRDENTRGLRPDTAELQAQAPTQGGPQQSHLPWSPRRGHMECGGAGGIHFSVLSSPAHWLKGTTEQALRAERQ